MRARASSALLALLLAACVEDTVRPPQPSSVPALAVGQACAACVYGPASVTLAPKGARLDGRFGAIDNELYLVSATLVGSAPVAVSIKVNGKELLTTADFSNAGPYARSVRLASNNRISVEASGATTGRIVVQIELVKPNAQLVQRSVSVSTAQFGGGVLQAGTVYESAPVSVGSVGLYLSVDGPHLVYLQDANSQIRGLAVSTPLNGAPTLSSIDATSTVAALVFSAPGVIETDPALASQTMQRVLALSCVQSLAQVASTSLPNMTLESLASDATFSSQLEACVQTAAAISATVHGKSVSSSAQFAQSQDGITVTVTQGQLSRSVLFENAAARYVDVYSRPSTGFGSTAPPQYIGLLNTATPLSWGSIFTGEVAPVF